MVFLSDLTVNGVLLMLSGLAVAALGVWMMVSPGDRASGVGFFMSGIGLVLLGFTNGFTDESPLGLKLYRIAVVSFVIGLPIVGYFFFRVLR
jgi:hypothetical protein